LILFFRVFSQSKNPSAVLDASHMVGNGITEVLLDVISEKVNSLSESDLRRRS
jgi:hypothetical protein